MLQSVPTDQPVQASNGASESKAAPAEAASNGAAKPGISAAAVGKLRAQTGAGMMDCKRALTETGGDIDAAVDYLRKKGLSGADKKASRIAAEGLIADYIHAGARY